VRRGQLTARIAGQNAQLSDVLGTRVDRLGNVVAAPAMPAFFKDGGLAMSEEQTESSRMLAGMPAKKAVQRFAEGGAVAPIYADYALATNMRGIFTVIGPDGKLLYGTVDTPEEGSGRQLFKPLPDQSLYNGSKNQPATNAALQAQVSQWFADNPNATGQQVVDVIKNNGGLAANPGLTDILATRYGVAPNEITNYYNTHAGAAPALVQPAGRGGLEAATPYTPYNPIVSTGGVTPPAASAGNTPIALAQGPAAFSLGTGRSGPGGTAPVAPATPMTPATSTPAAAQPPRPSGMNEFEKEVLRRSPAAANAPVETPALFKDGGEVTGGNPLLDEYLKQQMSEGQDPSAALFDNAQRLMSDFNEVPKVEPMRRIVKSVSRGSGGDSKTDKNMSIKVPPLAASKDLAFNLPSAQEAAQTKSMGSAREQMEELARVYQLKINAAKNKARGLGADTFGAPILEGPTLVKKSLTKRSFAEGGEVKKSEDGEVSQEELDAASRPAFVSPNMRRATKISRANDPTDRIMGVVEPAVTLGTGAVAAAVGMPRGIYKGLTSGKVKEGKAADIASKEAAAFIERNTYVPRSESGKENLAALNKIAEDLKLAPAPGGAAMASLARPTAVRAQGANIADDFQQYNQQISAPGASYAVRPDNPQFIPTTMMDSLMRRLSPRDQMGERPGQRLEKLRNHFGAALDTGEGLSPEAFVQLQRSKASLEQQAALDTWVNSTLKKYITRDMATPSDPVRKLAEDGITITAYEVGPTVAGRAQERRNRVGKPDRLGQSEAAKMYEDIGDASLRMNTAGFFTDVATDSSIAQRNPFLSKIDPNTPISRVSTLIAGEAEDNFKHLVDVIGEDLAAGRLRPEALNKLSMADAVKRAHAYNQDMAKRMDTARVDAMQSRPVYKQYDSGYKWIQLTEPGDFAAESDAMGHSVRGYEPPKGSSDWAPASGTSGFDAYGVGGWNAIKEGRAKIFSLRDEKGQPHATAEVEVRPGILSDWVALGEDDFQSTVSRLMDENPGIRNNDRLFSKMLRESPEFERFSRENAQTVVQQIKGKQNEAVAPKYQEFGQDFLRSGQWSKVKDADKVGLIQTSGGLVSKNEIIDLFESLPDNVKNTGFVQERLENLKKDAWPDYDFYGAYEYARDTLGGMRN
jgi:hypothetical protein